MQHPFRVVLTIVSLISFVATVGCQWSGDTPQPAASVNGPSGEKASPAADTTAGSPATKSDQDPLHPIVLVETSMGNFKVRLDAEKAPLTVDNFLNYVGMRHYDKTIFHQVLKDFPKVVMGGGFAADMTEKPLRTPIRNEAHNGLKNRRGTVAMARQADKEDSATCNFFINLADNAVLDYKDRTSQGYGYCVFGEVIEGLDTVERIGQVNVHDTAKVEQTPVETVAIKSIRQVK